MYWHEGEYDGGPGCTRAMFEGILEQMHDIEIAGPISYLRSNLIDGVQHTSLKLTGS